MKCKEYKRAIGTKDGYEYCENCGEYAHNHRG
jgi:ribosomal protein L32